MLVSGGRVYRFVVTPVLAPVEIGWVVFAIRLDQAELRSLERLSAIPLTATVLRRDGDGHWSGMAGHLRASAALDRLVGRPARDHRPEALELPGGRALSLAKPLAAADGTAEAAILLSYPDRLALAPYRPLQAGLLLAGLLGLLLVLFGSARLARGIASPISALDAAARALRAGARTELVPHGSDEIARLADSFNHMSAEIIDREHRISHLAFHDLLTELPNRTYFRQVLEETLARTGRTGEQVVVFCLDLDGFKGVNDTLGHPVGDALLRVIATMLVELVPGGTVSRLGGDEFAIILPNDGRARSGARGVAADRRRAARADRGRRAYRRDRRQHRHRGRSGRRHRP